MIKLCIFDFDSTLMNGESIDILAQAYGAGAKVSQITQKAMNNELDFFESLCARVALLKGMPYKEVLHICENLPLMPGALELINYLKAKNIRVLVFSGGFYEGINPAQKKLGFHSSFANYLHHKNGILSGLVGGEMMLQDSKGLMLVKLRALLKLAKEEIACVGDGANDIAMFKEAGLSIAFCAKEALKKEAQICVDEKDLSLLKTYF